MERAYEMMLILNPDLSDSERDAVVDKINGKIKDLEGKVLTSAVWEKERDFYYPINSRGAEKKKYTKGCYWLTNFISNTDKLPELKEIMRLEEAILRNIIIKKGEVSGDGKFK